MNSTKSPAESQEARTWQLFRAELLRFIRQRVPERALAEDIVQDVILKAYTHRGELKDPRKLRPWLYQITRHTLVDYYRSRKRLEELPEDLAGEAADESSRIHQELARCLLPLLDTLPAAYRRALRVTEFEGATQQDLASREGLSLSGAKSRVQRARNMLREVLLQCCRVEMDRKDGMTECDNERACDCHRHAPDGAPRPLMESTTRRSGTRTDGRRKRDYVGNGLQKITVKSGSHSRKEVT